MIGPTVGKLGAYSIPPGRPSHVRFVAELQPPRPWYAELTRYHWFVLIVCTLGWLFDCGDQQFFANWPESRPWPSCWACRPSDPIVERYTGCATSVMLIGWATGGILFGIMGDRIGRAKTMVWTILSYSVFTGLGGLSQAPWDFMFFRFMTGLGVGGQFAVGVSLVAEVMPDRAGRPPWACSRHSPRWATSRRR